MSEVTDYYDLLGVPETASPEAVKRAYRQLARRCHPDRNPGDPSAEERFKSVQRAYHVLSNPARRDAYDHARAARTSLGRDRVSHQAPSHDPLFSLFFDEPGHAGGVGADVEAQVRLSFDQALRGGTTDVRLAEGDSVRLTVPKGVRSGVKVRVRGRGRVGRGGRGDLYVTFRIEPTSRFRREGDNLHVVETVSAIEAVLGTTRSITNAYGQTIKATIPPGTQPGERLRLRGQGVEAEKRTGDLFVEVQVTVPRQLSDEQREALRETAERIGLL